MNKSVVAAKFSFPLDANIAKANLESVGIPSFVADEHTVNMQWLYSDAMGGVRLFVPEEYLQEARNVLSEDFSDAVDSLYDSKPESCPHCGSQNIEPHTKGKRPAFLVFILAGFPLFFYKHGLRCSQCGNFWET
ncbi:DUF2007 domain-containing protein [Psychromonas ossibalaenae]|uniref:putative signal transducing protein n=1 Tax=Psychromonas ossibalaenae TaxID=444922 RepID=UPI00036060BB|nr:DUF2007 domain-containing protein [Psychromonas ossibalaenae]